MGTTWTFDGFDVDALVADIEAYVPIYLDELAGEMAELGMELVARMQALIMAAETPTGRARVAQWPGLNAGRYDSGLMHDSVDYEVIVADGAVLLGWGWTEEFRDYFLYQEWGTSQIAAVGALGDSFTLATTRVAEIMGRLAPR